MSWSTLPVHARTQQRKDPRAWFAEGRRRALGRTQVSDDHPNLEIDVLDLLSLLFRGVLHLTTVWATDIRTR